MSDNQHIQDLDGSISSIAETVASSTKSIGVFNSELREFKRSLSSAGRDLDQFEKGLSKGLKRAVDGVIFEGDKMSDALETIAKSMIKTTYNGAMKPVTDHVAGMMSRGVGNLVGAILPFADGAPFSQGRVMPFASGGVVSGATTFGMRGGLGVMGEAGPEAIMPLARGADGKLGVRSGGGGNTHVVINVTTPDVQGFKRSQNQIAAQMSRVLQRGNRNR